MSTDDGRIDGQTIKSRPAGSIYPETEWSIPADDYVRSWLGEARAHFAEDQHARAIGRVMNAHTMQRIIRLVMRIQEQNGYADQLRRERDLAQQRVAILNQALDEANEEIARLKEANQANIQVGRSLDTTLARALEHLENVRLAVRNADEEFNFSGDFDPDGAPDA